MQHLRNLVLATVMAIAVGLSLDWKDLNISLSFLSTAATTSGHNSLPDIGCLDLSEEEEDVDWWLDTVMYAKGHAFFYRGDLSSGGRWYLDTVCVGNDLMLTYDSIGPSSLKLSLVTREIIVDLEDPYVVDKIKKFMNPIDGFNRFGKRYEECLDVVSYEGEGSNEYMGRFFFEADYLDNSNQNFGKICRFISELAGTSENEKANVPLMSAFYAGFDKTKNYRKVFSGNPEDMAALSDFLAHRAFENWKRGGDFSIGSNEAILAIRPHVSNKRFITFSKYEWDREGIGHGMYTETFHTFDLKSGKKLNNADIFKPQSLDKVKMRLFEIMAKDPHYLRWHWEPFEASDIEAMIEAWQSPSQALEGTEWEEPKRDFTFQLPEGALTDAGVVFSFQPYEIDCWAAGAFHFIVPYKNLWPYLTPEVKQLLKL